MKIKRLLSIILAVLVLALSFAACSKNGATDTSATSSEASSVTSSSAEEANGSDAPESSETEVSSKPEPERPVINDKKLEAKTFLDSNGNETNKPEKYVLTIDFVTKGDYILTHVHAYGSQTTYFNITKSEYIGNDTFIYYIKSFTEDETPSTPIAFELYIVNSTEFYAIFDNIKVCYEVK